MITCTQNNKRAQVELVPHRKAAVAQKERETDSTETGLTADKIYWM